jgi:chromatin modification-related protein YNG2
MIGCDNDSCPYEWFHLSCVGLTAPPPESATWLCRNCEEAKRAKAAGNKSKKR